jgi:hypothetical protein
MSEPKISVSAVRAARIPARTDASDVQVLHFPAALLGDIRDKAAQLKRSTDWCLHTAWCVAAAELECHGAIDAVKDAELLSGTMVKLEVELPLLTWRHLTEEAERLDRSKSWLLQRAWLIARPRLPDTAGTM